MNYKTIIAAILSLALSNDFENLSFGTDDALDVMTWNIEWFPKNEIQQLSMSQKSLNI